MTRRGRPGYPERMPADFARRTGEMRPFLAMEVMARAFAMPRAGDSDSLRRASALLERLADALPGLS